MATIPSFRNSLTRTPPHSLSKINDLHYSLFCHIIIFEQCLFRPFRILWFGIKTSIAKIPFLNHAVCYVKHVLFRIQNSAKKRKKLFGIRAMMKRNAQYTLQIEHWTTSQIETKMNCPLSMLDFRDWTIICFFFPFLFFISILNRMACGLFVKSGSSSILSSVIIFVRWCWNCYCADC